jgi:hypothetical protein
VSRDDPDGGYPTRGGGARHSLTKTKIIIQCKCCSAKIEVTPLDLPDDIPDYATVIKRGNVVCWECFGWLTKRR